MSVINQMLRDLETREGGVVARDFPGPDTESDAPKVVRVKAWVTSLVCVTLIGLIGVAAVVWIPSVKEPAIIANVHIETLPDPVTVTTVAPVSDDWEVAREASAVRVPMQPSINSLATLSDWRVNTSDSVTLVEIDLANKITYELAQSSGEVVLRMRGTTMSQPLSPLTLAGTPIVSVKTETEGDDLVMHLSINQPVQTQIYAVPQSDKGYRILLALQEGNKNSSVKAGSDNPFTTEPAAASPVTPRPVGDVGKTVRALTASEKIDELLRALPDGDSDQAWETREATAKKALRSAPEHIKARMIVARALVYRNSLAEAETVLLAGLKYAPHHPGLFTRLAELKVRAGDIPGAIELLQANLAAASTDPNYLAYLAALYRDQGKNIAAVALYRRALGMRPERGVWWMGLGISLEGAEASPRYILQVYLKAEPLTRSRPDLNSFVAQRLAQLSGQ